jgi:DNA (cytosine-5)-methyltransferase 1
MEMRPALRPSRALQYCLAMATVKQHLQQDLTDGNRWCELTDVRAVDSPTVLSLFSGAGGMDLGVERAGFQHIGFLEYDVDIAKTLMLNRPDWVTVYGGDVLKAAEQANPSDFGLDVGQLDLIVGGPPCQPFSSAGQWSSTGRQGMLDDRAATVHALMDIIEKFQPKLVMLENVSGFVSGKNAALPFITDRINQLAESGGFSYSIHWQLVNAADYGVPQHRRRVIMVLARDGFDWSFPEGDVPHRSAWDALGDLQQDAVPSPRGKWASLLPSIPEGQNYQWLTSRGGGQELFGYRTKYWHFLLKLDKQSPSWTLAASPGPSTGPFHWNNRPLSVGEAARLQSFPDEWRFYGNERFQKKQIGNATPPLLAETMALRARATLDSKFNYKAPTLLRPTRTDAPAPAVVLPLPAEYLHSIGSKEAHAGVGLGPGASRSKSKDNIG